MNRIARILAALIGLAVFDAQAGIGPNGLGPNGLGPNGLGPNGLGPNGLGPNGLGPNGLGPNGLGPNGLGPNGLGPNGLGPNGLDINGLGPNGLGPNGLGPNGISAWYLVTPDGTQGPSTFKAWFETDPAAAVSYMKYFVRCAYDGQTGVAYLDATGKTWGWTGQFGLAMTSFKTTTTDPVLGAVRTPMTVDEGKWVSACLLAHVNIQGSHQYISLRGSPPNPEAQAALMPGINEQWVVGDFKFGGFFGDLFSGSYDAANVFTSTPEKYACKQYGAMNDWTSKGPTVIGRNCDVEQCYYPDPANPAGTGLPLLTGHLGNCGFQGIQSEGLPPGHVLQRAMGSYSMVDPWYWYRVTDMQYGLAAEPPLRTFHPLFVNGLRFVSMRPRNGYSPGEVSSTVDVATCNGRGNSMTFAPWCTPAEAPFTLLVPASQVAVCGGTRECFGGIHTDPQSYKLVGLQAGQALDSTLRFTTSTAKNLGLPSLLPDMGEAFTAIIRYRKDRTGSANIWTQGSDGAWCDVTNIGGGDDDHDGSSSRAACRGPVPAVIATTGHHDDDDDEGERHAREDHHRSKGPDIWSATDAGEWEWLQVYPAYLAYDTQTSAFRGKHCTEDGQCAAGLTCTPGHQVCWKPANTTDASAPLCDAGLVHVNIDAPSWTGDIEGGVCVQPCTGAGAGDCGSGQACLAGRCVSPALKVRLSGAAMSESCTGAELFKGSNEQGSCSKVFKKYPLKNNTVCPRESESLPNCRGSLTWTKRQGAWGWYCRGGGEALYACLPEDSPDLDAVSFVPGKPWCASADATSFVGVCK